MATTNSLVTAVNQTYFNNFMAEDGTTHRIRDGQTFLGTAFGNLAVPAGATIDGILIEMEGQALAADHDAQVGDWISVSNDGGTTFSTAQSITTGTWSVGIGTGTLNLEQAGGSTELWGMSWDADSANDIQVRMTWSSSGGDAVYLDYIKVYIYYTVGQTTYTSDDQVILSGGTLELKSGMTIIGSKK